MYILVELPFWSVKTSVQVRALFNYEIRHKRGTKNICSDVDDHSWDFIKQRQISASHGLMTGCRLEICFCHWPVHPLCAQFTKSDE